MSEIELKRKVDTLGDVECNNKKLALDEEIESAANFVANQYELLKRILTYLPARQLARCARVCKSWREAGRIIQRDRERRAGGKPAAFWWTQPQDLKSESSNYIPLNKLVADHFNQKFQEFATKLNFTPKVIIIFNTDDQVKDEFQKCYIVQKHFPKAILFGGQSEGLVGTNASNHGVESEDPRNNKRMSRCSILFIPPWPGVHFKPLETEKLESTNITIPNTDAAVILSTNSLESISISNSNIALGGAGPDFIHPEGFTRALLMDNVRSAVVLLEQNHKTESKIRKVLSKLKGKFNEKHGFCLMLACCGRGKYFHKGKKDVETKIFHSIFPGVPIVGFFGNGEIGFNSKNTFREDEEFQEKIGEVDEEEIFHSFKTVFMVVSIDTTESTS